MVNIYHVVLKGDAVFTQVFKEANSLLVIHQAPANMQFHHRLFSEDLDLNDLALDRRHQLSIAMLTAKYPMDATFEVSTKGDGELRFRQV